ncbi:hypothetical protein D1872_249320 [compost metagenome]
MVHKEPGCRRLQTVNHVVQLRRQVHDIVAFNGGNKRLVQFDNNRMCVAVAFGFEFFHLLGKLLNILKVRHLLGKIIRRVHDRIGHVLQSLEKDILFLHSHLGSPFLFCVIFTLLKQSLNTLEYIITTDTAIVNFVANISPSFAYIYPTIPILILPVPKSAITCKIPDITDPTPP